MAAKRRERHRQQRHRSLRWSDELHACLQALADEIRASGPQGATRTSPSTVARALITEGIERWRHRSHLELERGESTTRLVSLGAEALQLIQDPAKPGKWELEVRLGDGSAKRFLLTTDRPDRTRITLLEVPE